MTVSGVDRLFRRPKATAPVPQVGLAPLSKRWSRGRRARHSRVRVRVDRWGRSCLRPERRCLKQLWFRQRTGVCRIEKVQPLAEFSETGTCAA
jgi:hypothetical protein